MKDCTLIASSLNEEGLWLAEILEVEGCKTQGNDLLEVIQKAEELREAIDTINGLQFSEEDPPVNEEKINSDVVGYYISHKNKANGSICLTINEVMDMIETFDVVADRGSKAFRRHLKILMTHLSLEMPILTIGPWTIQCKSIKKQLATAPKWDGWKDKWNGNEASA